MAVAVIKQKQKLDCDVGEITHVSIGDTSDSAVSKIYCMFFLLKSYFGFYQENNFFFKSRYSFSF